MSTACRFADLTAGRFMIRAPSSCAFPGTMVRDELVAKIRAGA